MVNVPEQFLVFVDPDSPVTQHNVNLIGAISSLYLPGELEHDEYVGGRLDLLPYERRDTSHFVSLFESSITAPYEVEVQAEFYRRTEFKDKPSRFACLFALGDMASCERAHDLYGWDLNTVRKFTLRDGYSRLARVNMEIVSMMRVHGLGGWDDDALASIWRHYWRGEGDLELDVPVRIAERDHVHSGVIWDLIDGQLELV